MGDLVLFAALTLVIWHRQVMDIIGWVICRRMDPHREPPRPAPGLRVAFITTFVPGSESLDMLRRTLASMMVADYPHDTWLLDEGDHPDVRVLCRQLGVRHFSRSGIVQYNQSSGRFLARTKAGNHNSWYAQYAGQYDIVAQVDTDFKVRRDFLTRTLGYFNDQRIAFVGTPQIYGNLGNLVARGAAQQTYLFYGPIMRALSRRRMSLLIGANHIVRVAALREIGWYQGHLTEDLATGIRFHAGRWESVYVPEALAVGEGPTTWTAACRLPQGEVDASPGQLAVAEDDVRVAAPVEPVEGQRAELVEVPAECWRRPRGTGPRSARSPRRSTGRSGRAAPRADRPAGSS